MCNKELVMNPYKLKLGGYMYCKGVEFYVMTVKGLCICDTLQEVEELLEETNDILSPTPQP